MSNNYIINELQLDSYPIVDASFCHFETGQNETAVGANPVPWVNPVPYLRRNLSPSAGR